MDLSWWRRTCPGAFAEFTDVFFGGYDSITSAPLRAAGFLMVLPVVRGLARRPRR